MALQIPRGGHRDNSDKRVAKYVMQQKDEKEVDRFSRSSESDSRLLDEPWLRGLDGWSIILYTKKKKLQVQFPVRATYLGCKFRDPMGAADL